MHACPLPRCSSIRWRMPTRGLSAGPTARSSCTSGLVDDFTEPQVRAVIAHELGHIRCNHTFYRMLAQGFGPVAAAMSAIPGGFFVAFALQWHLLDWARKSELTSDRFALLATGDLGAVQSVMMHFAGGAKTLRNELTSDAFREQAAELREMADRLKRGSIRDKLAYYASDMVLQQALANDHPWPAIRFVEIETWAQSRQYALIAEGKLAEAEHYPCQYMPETVADEAELTDSDLSEAGETPVLRRAASELAGVWKNIFEPQSSAAYPAAPPGWHPDPQQPGYLRWWNGSAWTDQVRSA